MSPRLRPELPDPDVRSGLSGPSYAYALVRELGMARRCTAKGCTMKRWMPASLGITEYHPPIRSVTL
jgi:hypothetical protein